MHPEDIELLTESHYFLGDVRFFSSCFHYTTGVIVGIPRSSDASRLSTTLARAGYVTPATPDVLPVARAAKPKPAGDGASELTVSVPKYAGEKIGMKISPEGKVIKLYVRALENCGDCFFASLR